MDHLLSLQAVFSHTADACFLPLHSVNAVANMTVFHSYTEVFMYILTCISAMDSCARTRRYGYNGHKCVLQYLVPAVSIDVLPGFTQSKSLKTILRLSVLTDLRKSEPCYRTRKLYKSSTVSWLIIWSIPWGWNDEMDHCYMRANIINMAQQWAYGKVCTVS